MLGFRLFSIAAVLIATTATFPNRLAAVGLDLYMHDTYFVVPHRYSLFGFALLSGVIAGVYYFGARASGNRLNDGLTIAHFLSWTFAVVTTFVVEFTAVRSVVSGRDPNQSLLVLLGRSAAFPAFVIGAVLFLVNFALAMVRKVRAS